MISTTYEQHFFPDEDFPFNYHFDTKEFGDSFLVHWHENIEVLYFREGSATVYRDAVPFSLTAGDVFVINSGALHSVQPVSPSCGYDCLIVDKAFLQNLGLPLDEVHLTNIVSDAVCRDYFDKIKSEFEQKQPYYKIAVKSSILGLFARLYRISDKHVMPAKPAADRRLEMVRAAISYIRKNFKNEISIEDICRHVGFSKYYFCREFKKITGRTVTQTINFLRCSHARSLLSSGMYNVAESAEKSGFQNLSYFTKTYKKYIGALPSKTYELGARAGG